MREGYIRPSDTVNCWMGDPSVASEPSDPNKFYAVGMIYCNPYNPKGEIYFCKNTGSPDNVSNWSCSILPPNDNWAYFKDKPWIIALGGGVISNVAYFYKDGSTVYLLDNGATWTSLGNEVSFNPGSFI
jgi:hypothetical protein